MEDTIEAFFVLLKAAVLSQVRKEYPNIYGASSFEEAEIISGTGSRFQKKPQREWVTFSFHGYDFWDLHLGVVLQKLSNNITIDIHIRKKSIQEKVAKIPWEKFPIINPTYEFKKESNEYKFVEPEIEFNIRYIGKILQEVIDKTSVYYRVVRKILE